MKSFIPINENGLAMILARTCCRSFNPKKAINDQIIELILKAGQAAPSAKNRQPYYFLIIKNGLHSPTFTHNYTCHFRTPSQ